MPALIPNFADWYQSQSPVYMTGPNKIRYASAYQQHGWALITRGKGMNKMLGGGTDIREKVMLGAAGTFQMYQPNDTLTASMPQTMSTLIANWRFATAQMTWTKQEELLNGGSADFTDEARVMKYMDFATKLETQFEYDICTGMEQKFIAVPDKDTMEAVGGMEPYCVHAFIHDHVADPDSTTAQAFNGQFVNPTTGTWTTVLQTNPTTAGKTRHKNRLFGYNSTAAKPTGGALNMINALDAAFVRLNYHSPAVGSFYRAPQNFEDSGWPKKIGFISQSGCDRFIELLRGRNDAWTKPNEAGMAGPMYNGLELIPLPRLDEIAAYQQLTPTSALVTEGSADGASTGPRIFIVDTDAFNAIFHRERFFERTKPREYDNQPYTYTVWGDVYFNFACWHRWMCGIVTPGTVSGAFPNQLLKAAGNSLPYAAY